MCAPPFLGRERTCLAASRPILLPHPLILPNTNQKAPRSIRLSGLFLAFPRFKFLKPAEFGGEALFGGDSPDAIVGMETDTLAVRHPENGLWGKIARFVHRVLTDLMQVAPVSTAYPYAHDTARSGGTGTTH